MTDDARPIAAPQLAIVRRSRSLCLERLTSTRSLNDSDPDDCSPRSLTGDAKVVFARGGGEGLDVCEFDFLKDIGHGSYGQVELWRYIPTEKNYVAKSVNLMKLNSHEQGLMLQELRLLRSLEHPHIAVCWQAWGMNSVLVLLLTYYPGGTLQDKLTLHGNEEEDAGRWICQLLSALRFLHAYNVVHRDVCPENIFLSEDQSDAVLGDLGACRVLASTSSEAKTPMGHMRYLSPEMFQGQDFTGKTDIWSLGIILLQLLRGKNSALVSDIRRDQLPSQAPTDPPRVSPALQEVMRRMLEHDIQLRPDASSLCCLPDLDEFWPLELSRIAPEVNKRLPGVLWNSALKLGAVRSMRSDNSA